MKNNMLLAAFIVCFFSQSIAMTNDTGAEVTPHNSITTQMVRYAGQNCGGSVLVINSDEKGRFCFKIDSVTDPEHVKLQLDLADVPLHNLVQGQQSSPMPEVMRGFIVAYTQTAARAQPVSDDNSVWGTCLDAFTSVGIAPASSGFFHLCFLTTLSKDGFTEFNKSIK